MGPYEIALDATADVTEQVQADLCRATDQVRRGEEIAYALIE